MTAKPEWINICICQTTPCVYQQYITVKKNHFDSNMIQKRNTTLLQHFPKDYFTDDVDRSKWAPSSEFVSSSIPSWQISTAHVQPFREARDLAFCLKVPLDSLLVWASSGGSGGTARMRRLAWTFAARIGDKYQIRLTRPKCLHATSSNALFSRTTLVTKFITNFHTMAFPIRSMGKTLTPCWNK